MVRCMHVCVHIVFETHERTSLRQPLRAAERPATVAAGATARPRTCTVKPQPLAATGGTLGSPVWVGVGGERVHRCGAAALTSALRRRCGSLNACGNVISGRARAAYSMFTQSVSCGVVRVKLVKVSQR